MGNDTGRVPRGCVVHTEGKTKIIWVRARNRKRGGFPQNKPFVTAGDGKFREFVPGKEVAVTTTTCNIFALLNNHAIPTHFRGKGSDDMYRIHLLSMIPIEIVVRRRAFGSYLKRNPTVKEGDVFDKPLVEFFYKKDVMSDPMMIWHPEDQCYMLYHPQEPPELRGPIGKLNGWSDDAPIPHSEAEEEQLKVIAIETFLTLEEAFKCVGVTLVDFKIECGYNRDRKLYVGDQIDGDSCRLWMGGDKDKAIDKDRYRDIVKQGRVPTPEEREKIVGDYEQVAKLTESFPRL